MLQQQAFLKCLLQKSCVFENRRTNKCLQLCLQGMKIMAESLLALVGNPQEDGVRRMLRMSKERRDLLTAQSHAMPNGVSRELVKGSQYSLGPFVAELGGSHYPTIFSSRSKGSTL